MIPQNIRIFDFSFSGATHQCRGRSNPPATAKSTNDPAPLNDLDIFTHTYVIGHLVFQVLAYRFDSFRIVGSGVSFPAAKVSGPGRHRSGRWRAVQSPGPRSISARAPSISSSINGSEIPITLICAPHIL